MGEHELVRLIESEYDSTKKAEGENVIARLKIRKPAIVEKNRSSICSLM